MSEDIEDFKSKYLKRLNQELGESPEDISEVTTQQYREFRQEYMPKPLSWYEKVCQISGSILQVSPDEEDAEEMKEAIDITHLNITPTDAMSFAILGPLLFIVVASLFGYILPPLLTPEQASGSIFMVLFAMISGMVMIYPLQKMPQFLSNSWRMKASNQMVLCVFYVVTFMRHTSNLELAIDFAAKHLDPPLSLDLKKIIWDIETGKHDSLKESLDSYLENWRDWNKEFIESMHLIESSLYETSENRRIDTLDKALDIMLQETYEKMLHYAHNLKSPLQALHMLGIVLPILGLVILPLIVSFMGGVHWYHIMILYNVALPIGVFYMGKNILSKRPTGYGETQLTGVDEQEYKKVSFNFLGSEVSFSPAWFAILIFSTLLLIGSFPLVMHSMNPGFDYVFTSSGVSTISDYTSEDAVFYFLGYRPMIQDGETTDVFIGPFGLGATLLSLLIPLAFGLGIGLYYKLKTKDLIEIREKAKELEEEFAGALFQLGNRLADGIPAEIAFEKVANVMQETTSGKFFELVSVNIRKLGMGLKKAIFDPDKGALAYYPSDLIESSMKVLVEAVNKGPRVASQALMNVSEYIKQMHRVDERLRDLMADVISDMQSQISFLTPAIAGIVVGITSMITKILGSLGENISQLQTETAQSAGGTAGFGGQLLNLFGTGMPTYWFQIIVGLYVVQVVYILTVLVNGIKNGQDKVMEKSLLGKYLTRTTLTYCLIAGVVMTLFNVIAGTIVPTAGVGG